MTDRPLTGYVLITGASAGLGASFSRRFAAEGRDLVLVARDPERLEQAAAELRARYPITVEVLPADLSTEHGCELVAARLADESRPVDSLINNAGSGLGKVFGKAPLAAELQLLDLNVKAVLRLTHAAVGPMTARGRGEIINISSVAGFLPRGTAASYAASKAWVTSFTEGVAQLVRNKGVRMSVICPGFIHTEFLANASAGPPVAPRFLWLDVDEVVAEGLAGARSGKVVVVPSKRYRAVLLLVRLLPRRWVASVLARR